MTGGAPSLTNDDSTATVPGRILAAQLRAANSLLDRLLAGERLALQIGDAEDLAWALYMAAEAAGVLAHGKVFP